MAINQDIATYAGTMAILRRLELRPNKRLGQNFLIDPVVCQKIITAAAVGSDDTILEIGPGLGALTQALARAAKRVIAVEIDQRFTEALKEFFAGTGHVEILQADFMKLDIHETLAARNIEKVKVAANLPYYITTPVLMRLLESRCSLESVTVMVQREVAGRLTAAPGGGEYGALSVMARYYADIQWAAAVPSHCFYPRPAVDSAVVAMAITERHRRMVYSESVFAQTVKAAFGKRRKTLVNCLTDQPWLNMPKEEIVRMITGCGFDARIRGETLAVQEFIVLANALAAALQDRQKGQDVSSTPRTAPGLP